MPAKPPPLCLRSISERKRWWRLRECGQHSPPLPSALEQLLEGTGWDICGLDGSASASWNPLKSLHGLVGEDGTFHHRHT